MSQTVLPFVGISWRYSSTFTLNYKNSQHKPEASRNFVFLAREEVAFILNFEQSRQNSKNLTDNEKVGLMESTSEHAISTTLSNGKLISSFLLKYCVAPFRASTNRCERNNLFGCCMQEKVHMRNYTAACCDTVWINHWAQEAVWLCPWPNGTKLRFVGEFRR